MTLFELVRNLRIIDQTHMDALLRVQTSIDSLNAKVDEMAVNLQQALAAVRAEVEDERNVFIGAVKLMQAQAEQVKAAADAAASGANIEQVAQDLNDLATQMRENAGPLAAAIVANTPQAVPPMAPSPAVPSGSGDGVSATLPQDTGGTGGTSSGASPSGVTAGGTPTTSPDTPPADGQTRVDPSDPAKLQRSADGKWYSEGENRTEGGRTFLLQNGNWIEQAPDGGTTGAARRAR